MVISQFGTTLFQFGTSWLLSLSLVTLATPFALAQTTNESFSDSKSASQSLEQDNAKKKLALIDSELAVSLYRLELAQYHLRLAELKKRRPNWSDSALQSVLPKPERPRIPMAELIPEMMAKNWFPLAVICSFQSVNCARLQTDIQDLEKQFGEYLKIFHLDFPLHFHRFDKLAALAQRCAAKQGKGDPYRKLLYDRQFDLNPELISHLAESLGLSKEQFTNCLDNSEQARKTIDTQQTYLQKKGINKVPVLLVDGYYFPFPFDWEAVKKQLSSAIEKIDASLERSRLPLELLSTVVREQGESLAQIRHPNGEAAFYQASAAVLPGVRLIAVRNQRVVFDEAGLRTYLPLTSFSAGNDSSKDAASTPASELLVNADSDQSAAVTDPSNLDDDAMAYATLEPNIRVNLEHVSRESIDEETFLSHFHPASHEVEGYHLIKLKGTANQSLFDELGLREDDVVLRVGEEWVHEKSNPLYDQLQSEKSFRLALMRRGQPIIIDYYTDEASDVKD